MKSTSEISNAADVIDSRDVIARIEALTELRDSAQEDAQGDKETMEDGTDLYLSDDFTEDEYRELKALESLQDEAEGYAADWKYGETLIRDDYFEDYARQTAEELGLISRDDKWPATCIDWEKAADELKQDYTAVEFDGVTYWIR
jgi:hypothetical protein